MHLGRAPELSPRLLMVSGPLPPTDRTQVFLSGIHLSAAKGPFPGWDQSLRGSLLFLLLLTYVSLYMPARHVFILKGFFFFK